MTPAHLHLALNHFPIVGVLASIVFLIAALTRRNSMLLRAGLLALVITALFALPVYFSGEPTEEVVENLAGVSHDTIEEHEEVAKLAFVGLELLGVLAAFGLYSYRDRTAPRWYGIVVGLLTVAVTTLTLWNSRRSHQAHGGTSGVLGRGRGSRRSRPCGRFGDGRGG